MLGISGLQVDRMYSTHGRVFGSDLRSPTDVTTVGGDGTFIYYELLKQQPAHALQPGLQVIQIG